MLDVQFQNGKILHGDVMDKIKTISDESISCVISSPPYWGLRDYGVEGQWGIENTYMDFLDSMDKLMAEIWRVLKKDGTCWINLGDTYASSPIGKFKNGNESFRKSQSAAHESSKQTNKLQQGIREKSRLGIPERFYIRCIDAGWIARNHIPWVKANAMPQSAQDRFSNKWESIFFFAKEKKYYFNLDAVREPLITEIKKSKAVIGTQTVLMNDLDNSNVIITEKYPAGSNVSRIHRDRKGNPDNPNTKYDKGSNGGRLGKNHNDMRKQDNTLGPDGKPLATYKNFKKKWKEQVDSGKYGDDKDNRARVAGYMHTVQGGNVNGKNPGDVFNINPQPFPEAHFATFPLELPLKILKCACPDDGIVLDPFFGSGTVGLAAEMLARNWIGIELKEEYVEIAKKRLMSKNITRL